MRVDKEREKRWGDRGGKEFFTFLLASGPIPLTRLVPSVTVTTSLAPSMLVRLTFNVTVRPSVVRTVGPTSRSPNYSGIEVGLRTKYCAFWSGGKVAQWYKSIYCLASSQNTT